MSENDNEQQSQIGKKLRDARQAKGYTLDDLQQLTKIQKRYLIAIEDEKFDELPGDFYVRAFIKQYADTVGLDGNELLKEFNEQLPKAKTEEYSDHISQAVETRANRRKTVSQGVSKIRQYMPTIIIACVIVIVLAAIWVTAIVRGHQDASTKIDNSSVSVSGESRKKSSSSSVKKKSNKSTQKSTAIKLTEASRNNNSVTYNAASLKKDTKLQIKTSGRAWNSVTIDGTSALSRTMDANSTADVTIRRTTNTVVITVGNAPATTLKIGNKKVNFTDNGRYNNTRTVTIHFGSSSSSSAANSSSSRTGNNGTQQTTTQSTRANQTNQNNVTTAGRSNGTATTNQGQNRAQVQQSQTNRVQSR